MKVIGTAGHIDHGKSTLVHRLTGIDPDRLPEEKRRGMTIDLGFAWLTLPSGREVSLVDVPGHERFVKTMVAGVGGVDVALLVIAADEGVMPQTREHLDILDLIGVDNGVVALSKCDLVDGEWLELVRDDVLELLSSTSLGGSRIVPVSGVTGEGIPDLLVALDEAVGRAPVPRSDGLPYLPVDRVFTVSGFGTVVTGTLYDGRLQTGQEVIVAPRGRRARIRGMQTHRSAVDVADAGTRVAANLSGVARDDVERGDALMDPSANPAVRYFDASVRVTASAPFPLSHGTEITVHVGSAVRTASLSILGDDQIGAGSSGWARFRLHRPAPVVRGQRYIARLPAPARTVAGGAVADVSPRFRRSDPATLERLTRLTGRSSPDVIIETLRPRRVTARSQLAALSGLSAAEADAALKDLLGSRRAVAIGDGVIDARYWDTVSQRARDALSAFHTAQPLRRGMSREQLRSEVHWRSPDWTSAVQRLRDDGVLREDGPIVASPTHVGGTSSRADDAARVIDVLSRNPFSPPSGQELCATARTEVGFLEAMREEGAIVRIADGLYFTRQAYDRIVEIVLEEIQARGTLTVASLRDTLQTSRKYALALLEYLDAAGVTRRTGDQRVLGNRAPRCV